MELALRTALGDNSTGFDDNEVAQALVNVIHEKGFRLITDTEHSFDD